MAFAGACAILALTPGPDTFLTLRFAANSIRAGLVYTVAVALGVLVWAVLALTGVAALLERFPEVRTGLTWLGGSYLVFLGVAALLQVRRARQLAAASTQSAAEESHSGAKVAVKVGAASVGQADDEASVTVAMPKDPKADNPPVEPPVEPRMRTRSLPAVFRTGVISSLTNPKTGLFFLALLPPFLPANPSPVDHAILVATVVACMLMYGAGLSVVARRVGRLLTGGSGPLIVDGVAGSVLVVLGVTIIAL